MADSAKNTAAEVGIRLVVDSNAKKAADDLKHDLTGAEAHAKKKAGGIREVFSLGGNAKVLAGLVTGGIGLAVAGATAAFGALTGAAYKSVEAFEGSQKQVKEIAGTLTLIDQRGNAFQDLREYAADLKDELEGLAIELGTTDDTAVAMFNDIAERGNKSVDQTKELTRQMILAGRAFPGGPEALAEGFSMLQMGMVRARNPVVQMIAATHTLKGNAKQVAAQLQKMSLDEQMATAEKAIGKMSSKMKDVPMTMGEMKKSMGVAFENIFETAGEPMTKGLKPIVAKARELLVGNQDALNAAAEMFGKNVAKGLDFALDIMNELIGAVKANWKDISGAFNELRDVVEPVFKYIYENRKSFAKTFADIAVVLIKTFTWIAKTMASVYSGIGTVLKEMGKVVPGLGDFIREEERSGQVKELRTKISEKGGLSDDEYKKMQSAFVENAKGRGVNAEMAFQEFSDNYRRAMDDHLAIMKQVEGARDAALTDDAAKFAAAFNVAHGANDKAAEQYVVKFLEGNIALQNALSKAGPEIFKDGFDAFLDALKEASLGDAATALKKGAAPNLGVGGKANVTQNFNGPINIKQDFRDQDPDDIAVVFKEELAKAGTNRLQSTFASPGGF